MAYNTLSGTVEFAGANGSIENTVRTDDSDQTIDGKKTFLQRITASAITLNGTVLAPPVITSVTNASATRVTFFNSAAGLEGHSGLVYTAAGGLTSSYFSGSGRGITQLRGDRFTTTISASNIKYGNGLDNGAGADVLTVSGGAGINVTATGVKPNLDIYGGLNLNATTIVLDADQTYDITNGGQSLASADKLFVQDVAGASPASPTLRSMPVSTLSAYLQSNLTFSPITTYNSAAQYRLLAGAASGDTVAGQANLTFDGTTLAVVGDISGSGNASINKLSIGEDTSSTRLYVTSQTDNEVVAIFKSPSHDTILAMTGSGQVVVGGLYLAAKLNITGSDIDKLISAKSDSANPAFYVSGSGDAYISGSLRAKQLSYTTHKFSPGNDGLVYLRFDTVGIDIAPTNNNKMVAPHNGKLIKVLWRFEGTGTGGSTTTAFSLHKGVTNQQQIQATPVATVNLVDNFIDDTTYTATFLDTAVFASGDIVGVSVDPAFDPGITVVTCVWEFDQNN